MFLFWQSFLASSQSCKLQVPAILRSGGVINCLLFSVYLWPPSSIPIPIPIRVRIWASVSFGATPFNWHAFNYGHCSSCSWPVTHGRMRGWPGAGRSEEGGGRRGCGQSTIGWNAISFNHWGSVIFIALNEHKLWLKKFPRIESQCDCGKKMCLPRRQMLVGGEYWSIEHGKKIIFIYKSSFFILKIENFSSLCV